MSRKIPGPIDRELLYEYIIPSLRTMQEKLRQGNDCGWWGAPKPGRAKTCELAADWLEELLDRFTELEADFRAVQRYVHDQPGRRRRSRFDVDEWLAAKEREAEEGAASAEQEAVMIASEQTDPHYRCPECGIEIEPGERVAASHKGLKHYECPV